MEKVVGIGEVLWDIFLDGKVLGGAPGNFAIHANSLGLEGIIISAIGKDLLGENIKEIYKQRSLKSYLTEVHYPTGTVNITLDSNGKASYEFTLNSAWDYLELSKEQLEIAKECRAVCFGTLCQRSQISKKSIYNFLEQTSDKCIKVFDINIRKDYFSYETIKRSLEYATILKLNDEELPILQNMLSLPDNENESLKTLKKRYNLDIIILTKGNNGSRLFKSESEDSIVKPNKVEILDTVGAGDSFTAAVVAGLIKGKSLNDINIMANKVASYVCTQKGATPALNFLLS